MPWLDISNVDLGRGLYYGCHDLTPRVSTLRFEMHPQPAVGFVSGGAIGDSGGAGCVSGGCPPEAFCCAALSLSDSAGESIF